MITVRPAEAADWPALRALWVAAWQAAMPEIDFTARAVWLDRHVAGLRAGGAVLLVAAVAEPVGFATVDAATGEMDQLAVAPGWEGRGVGAALMAAAKAMSPGGISLSVNQANARAVRFYGREGFRVTGSGRNARSGLAVFTMAWP